jgi:hypothetical protein
VAGAVAGLVSGAPSTLYALVSGRDPLEATLAAGSLLLPHERRRARLVAAAVPVHAALSIGWGVVLARTLPRQPRAAAGAVAGLAIAAVDLGVVGRGFWRVRALPQVPQLLDHLAYGATVAVVLARLPRRGR